MSYSEAVEAVGKLLAAFPNGSPANAKGYIGALAAVLADYPRSVAMKCSDPLKGVARETRFLPTIADLVGWCERETQALRRPVDLDDRFAGHARASAERAEAAAKLERERVVRPTLKQMQDKYGPNWGIANGGDGVTPETKAKQIAEIERANRITLERSRQADGKPTGIASPELVRLIEEKRTPHQPAEAAE